MTGEFRKFLYPLDHPRLAGLDQLDLVEYADAHRNMPVIGPMIDEWLDLFEQTRFTGITDDGTLVTDLFRLGTNESAPNDAARRAVTELLEHLDEPQRLAVSHPLDSRVWRAWMNPEFYLQRYGLRLEDLDGATNELVLNLIRASTSPRGYAKTVDLMRINKFLGDLVGLPKILCEGSYNINIFGTPAPDQPWGWNLYGHHLTLNTLFIGDQQVFTPVFFGAEPNEIDEGPYAGTTVFTGLEADSLAMIRALSPELAEKAILYHDKRDSAIPAGRIHYGDELHLGGAFRDNRVIPHEGVSVAEFDGPQRDLLLRLVEQHLDYQPDGPRAARMAEIRQHLDDTWLCWIGGTGDEDTFYYRIQSPVIMVEFDHHAGIFLANEKPERFHIHTLVRTPNGNDYGHALACLCTGRNDELDGPA
ncbi:DUF3500 domain-containing protein [Nocardia alni]|uniref:DUF3500 domain-containing protein n=1 Tax=Nocardia alni TaxID=2815723 RepID=UPI001C24A64F|nr:DUF3500 domain-containing protein [Nocardia alni]